MEKWNAQRAQAVYSALVKFLYPLMQKELHTKLLNEAKEHVLGVRIYGTTNCYFLHALPPVSSVYSNLLDTLLLCVVYTHVDV